MLSALEQRQPCARSGREVFFQKVNPFQFLIRKLACTHNVGVYVIDQIVLRVQRDFIPHCPHSCHKNKGRERSAHSTHRRIKSIKAGGAVGQPSRYVNCRDSHHETNDCHTVITIHDDDYIKAKCVSPRRISSISRVAATSHDWLMLTHLFQQTNQANALRKVSRVIKWPTHIPPLFAHPLSAHHLSAHPSKGINDKVMHAFPYVCNVISIHRKPATRHNIFLKDAPCPTQPACVALLCKHLGIVSSQHSLH